MIKVLMPGEESRTKPAMHNLSSFLSLPSLISCTAVQICYKVKYNGVTNVLLLGAPSVYPTRPIRLQKDRAHKLF